MKRLPVLLLTVFVCLWGAMTLGWPHGLDQGIFAWVGSVIADGGAPYADAWEIKGPATHMVYAATQLLLGHNEWGIRLFDWLLLVVSLVAAYRLGRSVTNRFGGLCGATIFFGLYGGQGFWHTAQPDGWFAMLLLVALAIAARPDFADRMRWQATVGALVGVAALLKMPYVVFLAPLALVVVMRRRGPWRSAVPKLATLTIAFAVPIAAVLGWLACHPGGLAGFAEVQFRFNPSVHVAEASPWQFKAVSVFVLYTPPILACVPLFVLGLVVAFSRDRAVGVLLLASMCLALLCLLLQAKYYDYHWHPVRAVYAVTSGMGLGALFALWKRAQEKPADGHASLHLGTLTWTCCILVLGLCLRLPVRQVVKWGSAVAGLRPWRLYYEQVGGPGKGDNSSLAIQEAAAYVAQHTQPDDTVLVWGFNPLINYLAQRRSPSRFGFNHALTRGPANPLHDSYRREFMAALLAAPPAYIVTSDSDQQALLPKSSKQYLAEFAELKQFVDTRYHLETTVAGFEMWRRVEPQ